MGPNDQDKRRASATAAFLDTLARETVKTRAHGNTPFNSPESIANMRKHAAACRKAAQS
jgi:hypothetical protein